MEHAKEEKSEFYIPTVVDYLIKSGKGTFKVLPTEESWFGVTYSADRPMVVERLRQLHEKGVYPTPLMSK